MKPPEVYRMARCRRCPYHCRPCLTVDEAEGLLADATRRTFDGNDLCQTCHRKSNRKANEKSGDGTVATPLTLDELARQIALMTAKLEELGNG